MGKFKLLDIFSSHKKESQEKSFAEVPDERLRVLLVQLKVMKTYLHGARLGIELKIILRNARILIHSLLRMMLHLCSPSSVIKDNYCVQILLFCWLRER